MLGTKARAHITKHIFLLSQDVTSGPSQCPVSALFCLQEIMDMPPGCCASDVNSSFGEQKRFYKNTLSLPTIHDLYILCLWVFCCSCLCLLPLLLGLAPQYFLETSFPTPSSVEKQRLELRGSGKRDGYILTNLLAFWVL